MKYVLLMAAILGGSAASAAELLVEAEGFSHGGGWLLDPQFLDVMGSPYLLAHGLGQPVANAATEVDVPQAGAYRLWVRTKDWVPTHHPGMFRVIVSGTELAVTFGNQGQGWIWQDGGTVEISDRKVRIELRDLTGFDGRCDALYFTTDMDFIPPDRSDENLASWRRRLRGLPETPPAAGRFDVVVVGGGLAGCSAALAAARRGMEVALIHDRPVLGGNGSPEIGITPRGENRSLVQEVAGPDREQLLRAQKNLQLFLGWHAFRVQRQQNHIESVDAKHTTTNEELRFAAPVFIDCTGHGSIGVWAGAEYRLGREASAEFDESLAPPAADKMHHGNTVVFNFCLHYPGDKYDFRLGDWKWIPVQPYPIPFRCLYSRNVDNLLMAGKHISVTHVAGSSTKTMLNGGQTGVATGLAAFLCKKHQTTPRGVYQQHLQELRDLVLEREVVVRPKLRDGHLRNPGMGEMD